MEALVQSGIRENILTITLNNPGKLNCIKYEMLQLLEEEIRHAENDDAVRVVVFRGAGEKSFSTGGDLKQFRSLEGRAIGQWIQRGHELFARIENLPKPTIAVIQGYALGGGLELALACDFRIATPGARFGMPELQHGWPPGWGGITRLKQLVGEARAKELILLGDVIEADRALNMGLVHNVVAELDLADKLTEMTCKLLAIRPDLAAHTKAALQGNRDHISNANISFDILATYYTKLVNMELKEERS